ncbi:MAG: type II toxin-antitoxin system RelE/ParE family toxin [Elusimicrobia bacterium]|nr:type II toxin-antitoxin system RelE/ParE family toxin [Elusimicrobiota bacterium]
MNKAKFRVRFYRAISGKCQACDYARAMDINHQTKAKKFFKALGELGPEMPEDYAKHLKDGIWELRIIILHHQHRFLYFFRGELVVVTNAFLKKSAAVPEAEIERAKRAMLDWTLRRGWEDI